MFCWFLLVFMFDAEDGGFTFLRNACKLPPDRNKFIPENTAFNSSSAITTG